MGKIGITVLHSATRKLYKTISSYILNSNNHEHNVIFNSVKIDIFFLFFWENLHISLDIKHTTIFIMKKREKDKKSTHNVFRWVCNIVLVLFRMATFTQGNFHPPSCKTSEKWERMCFE